MNSVLLAVRKAAHSIDKRLLLATAAIMSLGMTTFAQTAVPLVVPTNEIFESVNTWLEVFAPIVAIGVGIAIALAILTFIGKQILQAF